MVLHEGGDGELCTTSGAGGHQTVEIPGRGVMSEPISGSSSLGQVRHTQGHKRRCCDLRGDNLQVVKDWKKQVLLGSLIGLRVLCTLARTRRIGCVTKQGDGMSQAV